MSTRVRAAMVVGAVIMSAFLVMNQSFSLDGAKLPEVAIPPADSSHGEVLKDLQSEESSVRTSAARRMHREYRALTSALIQIASQEDKQEEGSLLPKRELAVKLLAEFGCRDAIPVFIKHIDYRQQMVVSAPSFLNGYPCALALRKIGHSAVPDIIYYLQVPEPDPVVTQQRVVDGLPPVEVREKQIELFAWLFLSLYGQNDGGRQEAIRVVRGARDRAVRKENLTRLLTMLETLTDPKKRREFLKKTYRPGE